MSAHAERSHSLTDAVESELSRAATDGERVIAVGRLALGTLGMLRSVVLWLTLDYPDLELGAWISTLSFAAVIAFSVFVLVRYRARNAPATVLLSSVALDALVCFAALATNSLSPSEGYRGLLFKPDPASIVIIVIAAGLRLSVSASLLGGGLALASIAGLVGLDTVLHGPLDAAGTERLTGLVTLVVGAAAVATVTAWRTRALAHAGALRTLESLRGGQRVGTLLERHGDLRSRLASAAEAARVLRRGTERGGAGARPDAELREVVEQLADDLGEVNEFLGGVQERSRIDVFALLEPERVAVAEAAARVLAQLRLRFRGTRLSLADGPPGAHVWLRGGAEALERLLQNLVVNACEGDGVRRARHVELRIVPAAEARLAIEVRDDGPGLPSEVLAAAGERTRSTKPWGSGMGLGLVRRAVESSGGRLALANDPQAGACARVELIASEQVPAPLHARPTETALAELLSASTAQGERAVALGRMAIGAVALARSVWIWTQIGRDLASGPAPVSYSLGVVAGAFSIYTLLRLRDRRASRRLLFTSMLVDGAVCGIAIGTNVFWPWPGYDGIVETQDLTLLLIPVLVAGLRLSTGVAAASGLLGLVSFALLLGIDLRRNELPVDSLFLQHASAAGAILVAGAFLAIVVAWRTRRIVHTTAAAAADVERAEARLALLLRDHHDVGTLLSSASLNAELVWRALEAGNEAPRRTPAELRDASRRIRHELQVVNEFVARIKELYGGTRAAREEPGAAPAPTTGARS